MKNYRQSIRALLTGSLSIFLMSACSSNNDDVASETPTDTGNTPVVSVEAALESFQNSFLPRFALSNSEVTAAEIYRRVDYSADASSTVSWGVEGASDDELVELETRYDDEGNQLESGREELLESLPDAINIALLGQYPDAVIDEIARSTTDGLVAYAILFETLGGELEANYDDNAQLLFVEEVMNRADMPASVVATADAQGVTLPDAEFETTTFANGSVSYAVEFENEVGQSITVTINEIGDVIRVEHEDALENLSTSDTVAMALADFPAGIEADFAAMFSEVSAAEIFRSSDLTAPSGSQYSYGIEGLSEDESLEIEALYSPDVVLLKQGRGTIIDTLPAAVDSAFTARYPNASIEEIAEVMDDEGTSYAIAFFQADEELEVNYDAAGEFLSLEDVLEESEIPAAVLNAIGDERVLLPIVEFEEVTAADGTVSYVVEYENDQGDSISYQVSANGALLKVDHEAALIN